MCIEKEYFDKNVLSSTHINFLFGAGINGSLLPQLEGFTKTNLKLKGLGIDISEGIETAIDKIDDAKNRDMVKNTFIEEIKGCLSTAMRDDNFYNNESVNNIEKLIKKVFLIVNESQNRNPSMKQINIYTLNYDNVIETIMEKLGFLYNSISASNNSTKSGLMNVIGYNYSIKKYIPTFMISKLHGDIDNPIVPGREKYKDILNENYFEVAFNMKEQLCRFNSILFVIGYSGRDGHINKILDDCVNAGLTIFWYKFSKDECIPFENKTNVIVIDKNDQDNKKDTSLICYGDMETAWAEKLVK